MEKKHTQERYVKAIADGDPRTVFEALTSELLALREEDGSPPSITERNRHIIELTDAYVEATGRVPNGRQLQRLANWILYEVLTDRHPDKVSREEYPILTGKQLMTRHIRERANEHIEEVGSGQISQSMKRRIHRKKQLGED